MDEEADSQDVEEMEQKVSWNGIIIIFWNNYIYVIVSLKKIKQKFFEKINYSLNTFFT